MPNTTEQTQYGGIVALPSFLYATDRIVSGYVGGLPGVHAMSSGADWTRHKPVRRSDEIHAEVRLKDLTVHETRFAGRAVQQTCHVDFFNQQGDAIASADTWCCRMERNHAREKGTKYTGVKARPPRRHTEDELAQARQLYRDEPVRGASKRYWEDVTEGEALPVMCKGPMTVTGFIACAQDWGGKFVEDGRALVEIEQEARNQDDELSVLGRRYRRTAPSEMKHPLRASRAPSRGQRQRPGEAGSAAFARPDLVHASWVALSAVEN